MRNPYFQLFRIPGALKFTLAAAIARFPMSMQGLSIMLAISAIYKEYGIAGTANAILVITFSIANPIYARLVDRHGQSKILAPLMSVNLICLAAMTAAIVFQMPSLMVYMLAAANGLTSCAFGAYVRSRWTFSVSNTAQLNTAFSWESAVDEVIYIFGPIIATFLVTTVHVGSGLIFCIICIPLGGFWLISQKATEPPAQTKTVNTEQKSLFRSGAMITLCTIFLFCGVAYGSLDLAIIAFCRENQAESMAGVILAALGVASFTAAILYGSRQWQISPLRLFSGGILLMAVSFSTLLLANTINRMIICMFCMGIFYAPTMTNANNLLQRIVPASRFTEGLAWFTTSFTLGISAGAAIAGYIIDYAQSWGGMVLVVSEGWLMFLIIVLGLLPLRNSLRRTANDG